MSALANFFFGPIPVLVAKLLRANPNAWTLSSDEAHGLNGISVWISNGPGGVSVYSGRCKFWGGVSFLSAWYLSPGHWLIWSAFRHVKRVQFTAKIAGLSA